MDETDVVKVTFLESGILQLVLNRPESLNALNSALMERLSELFRFAKEDVSVKAVLITGEGKAFCAGADIKQLDGLSAQSGYEFARKGQSVFRILEQLGKPSLAAINGYALGGGCELAMAATFRFAAREAQFSQPEIKLGVIPGFGGTQRLSRLIGKGRALQFCLSGKNMSAEEALQYGLVTEMIARVDLLSRAIHFLEDLIQLPPRALQSIITVIDQGFDLSLEDAFELEASHFGLCCATHDKKEGVTAFIEKRKAVFSGE